MKCRFIVGDEACKLLREYESTVLDRLHESLPLWNCPPEHLFYALFGAFDSIALHLFGELASTTDAPSMQSYKNLEDGLGQGIRWIQSKGPRHSVVPSSSSDLIYKASEFLDHARDHEAVADFHRAFGRGLVDVSVDPARPVVRFHYRNRNESVEGTYGWLEDDAKYQDRHASNRERMADPQVRRDIRAFFDGVPYRLEDGHVRLTDLRALDRTDLDKHLFRAQPKALPELPDRTDLGSFSLGELDLFWRAVCRWSDAAVFIFVWNVVEGRPRNSCLPTQVVPRKDFARGIQFLTSLSSEAVSAILERLTLSPGRKADILLQPFVERDSLIAWSPRVALAVNHRRNMLKLMARTPALKHRADNIVGDRERPMLRELGEVLSRNGYAYKLLIKVHNTDEVGEIDLVAWTARSPAQLLLVEGKGILDPDEVNEVDQATDVYLQGQKQLRKIMRILPTISCEDKARSMKFVPWTQPLEYFGFVFSREALPNNRYDHTTIPGTSLSVINRRLRQRDFKTPKRLVDALRERPWMNMQAEEAAARFYRAVKIGRIRYELPSRLREPLRSRP